MIRAYRHSPAAPMLLVLAVLGAAVLGWAGTIALHAMPIAADGDAALASLPPAVRRLVRFCGAPPGVRAGFASWMLGWALMVVAMMLPPALPLLLAAERLLDGRADRVRLSLVMLGGFVGLWVAAGSLLFAAGSVAGLALGMVPGLDARPGLAAGIAAIGAGLFQFTPLKRACLVACRSPASVMMVRWDAAAPRASALRIGLRYGAICVACCWPIMALGVIVGALMLPVMVVCALLMSLERLLPVARPLIPVQAGFAIAIGMLLLAGVVPPASM